MNFKRNRIRLTLILTTLFLIAVPATASAAGSEGDLAQKADPDGCITNVATAGCTTGKALDSANSVTVSPDGKSAYVTSVFSDAVAVFDRDTTTGKLTQKADPDGCITNVATAGCTTGKALDSARSVTVSPDGKSAYVASRSSGAVAVFDRDTTTGKLTQKADPDGCITNVATAGCTTGKALDGADSVTVSPDGKSAYVASYDSDAVAVFDRDTTTGKLTQKADPDGCITNVATAGCTTGKALNGNVTSVTVSPDGKSAYVTSRFSGAVAVFDRDTTTGKLTQKADPDGCITNVATAGCTTGKELLFADSVTVSPDGKSAYVASFISDAVAVFDRDTTTGKLTQKADPDGCITNVATAGCTTGKALDGANSVTVSPDGKSAYVTSYTSGAVAVFDRDTTTGALTQKTDPDGCIIRVATTTAGCTKGKELYGVTSVTVSPDGKSAYVASYDSDAVAVFDRVPAPLTNTSPITIPATPDGTGAGSPFPSTITVSGEETKLSDVNVTLHGLSHTYPDDLDMILIGPTGASTILTSDAGGSTDIAAVDLTFDDQGPGQIPDAGPISSGTYRPTNFGAGEDFDPPPTCNPGPEGVSPAAGCLATAFNGTDPNGTWSLFVADDGALDNGRLAYGWSLELETDIVAPVVSIDSGPTGPTSDTTPTFGFSADESATFECRLYEQGTTAPPFSACSGPGDSHTPASALAEGDYTFEVRATDAATNAGTATGNFTVDTTAPDTTITTGPNGTITTDQASFTFSGTPASDTAKIQCRIDSGPFADCTSPKAFTGLTDGPHTATFRAEDAAGNQDPTPATRTFTVDTTAPDTTIDSGPTGTIATDQASFTFSGTPASDTAKIQCRIDSEPFADCTSPKAFSGLTDGPHTATFRAEDAAGNQDPTPATETFTVDTTVDPPVVDPPVVDPPVDPPVGKAKIGKVKVKGPAKVKKGKNATYKVKIKNSGNAAATGVKLSVKGKGITAKKSVGKIAAGKAKTVKVKLKPKKPGKIKVSFKVTSKNAGGKTVKKTIKVKK